MCLGDFNDILYYKEKQKGRVKEKRKVECFKEMVDQCQLNDAGFKGQRFTWIGKKRRGGNKRKIR